jgi:uncharacterized membrane protein
MPLALMTSPSQDAMIVSLSALAAGLFISALCEARLPRGAFIALCTALALIAMARPPYIPIAVVPLLIPGRRLAWRIAGVACVATAVIVWTMLAAEVTGVAIGPGVDPTAQALRLLAHPARIVSLAIETFRFSGDLFIRGFIGQLGWLDVDMPHVYNKLAIAELLLAAILAALRLRGISLARCTRFVGALVILTSASAIFAIQYLTWTKLGAPIVDGVQGRYFLPLAMLAVGLLPSAGRPVKLSSSVRLLPEVLVALFPVLTITIIVHALILRYYLG